MYEEEWLNLDFRKDMMSESAAKTLMLVYPSRRAALEKAGQKEELLKLTIAYIEAMKSWGSEGCREMKDALKLLQDHGVKLDLSRYIEPDIFDDVLPPPPKNCNSCRLIFMDFETNGLIDEDNSEAPPPDVLQAAGLQVLFQDGNFFWGSAYNRFYFPTGPFNEKAIAVNRLTPERLKRLRRGNYPLHFKDDVAWLRFIEWGEVFVAHNLNFDEHFAGVELPVRFCTMKYNVGIVKNGYIVQNGKKYPKWANLAKAASHYKVEYKQENLHDGFYDVALCAQVFAAMYRLRHDKVMKALAHEPLPYDFWSGSQYYGTPVDEVPVDELRNYYYYLKKLPKQNLNIREAIQEIRKHLRKVDKRPY